MPTAVADGIRTRYEITGSGPALLMFSPGGFDSTLESWTSVGIYRRLNLVGHLAKHFTCITFDRRESGQSGGRIERIGWGDYAAQAAGLLDHLGVDRAFLMGGCVGCSTAATLALEQPRRIAGIVLYSPAGGVRYRLTQHARFNQHLAYVGENGLEQVVELAHSHELGFTKDPRVGPWAAAIRTDAAFAAEYAALDVKRYQAMGTGMARLLFDRDTVPGPEPEDLLGLDVPALIVPGNDPSHAPSAAHYLRECLPRNEFWDVAPDEQTEQNAPPRIVDFLASL